MSIYILRHGQTDWNKAGIVQGRYNVPLNDTGREQAKEAGKQLKDVRIDLCYCSPLIRAKETAQLALEGRDIEIIEDNRLVEMAYGVYEGTDWRADEYQYKRRLIANRYENGENYFDVAIRAYGFLEEIGQNSLDKNILVVCHGGIGRVIRSFFNDSCNNDDFIDIIAPNGGVEKYDYKPRYIPPVIPLK